MIIVSNYMYEDDDKPSLFYINSLRGFNRKYLVVLPPLFLLGVSVNKKDVMLYPLAVLVKSNQIEISPCIPFFPLQIFSLLFSKIPPPKTYRLVRAAPESIHLGLFFGRLSPYLLANRTVSNV